MVVKCEICKEEIVKYLLDVGDTVCLHGIFICDDCAEEIAIQLIKR